MAGESVTVSDATAALIRRDVTRYLDELIANGLAIPAGADGLTSSGSTGQ